jgi:hypothetical protein
MRIIAMTNEGQLPMMKNMLNSALKAGFPMDNFHCYVVDQDKNAATYNTKQFQSITLKKLEVILMNLQLDREILWIDNDIYLFQNMIDEIRSHRGNLVMQDDLWGPCTGFFLARSSVTTIRVFQKTIQSMRNKLSTDSIANDQHEFLGIYRKIIGLIVSILPHEEYPNGEVYFNQNKKEKAKMVHNNYLPTTSEKIVRFKECELWDESDVAYNQVKLYYI